MTDEQHHADLAALLGWYRDMGANEALAEAPINWLERGEAAPGLSFALQQRANPVLALNPGPRLAAPQARRPALPSTPPVALQRPFAAVLPDAAIMAARSAAGAARSCRNSPARLQASRAAASRPLPRTSVFIAAQPSHD